MSVGSSQGSTSLKPRTKEANEADPDGKRRAEWKANFFEASYYAATAVPMPMQAMEREIGDSTASSSTISTTPPRASEVSRQLLRYLRWLKGRQTLCICKIVVLDVGKLLRRSFYAFVIRSQAPVEAMSSSDDASTLKRTMSLRQRFSRHRRFWASG